MRISDWSSDVCSSDLMGRGGATPVRLALAGAAMSALLASFTSTVLLLDVDTLDQFRFWVVGSLAGRDADVAAQVMPFLVVGTLLALASARSLTTLALGEDVARSLGHRVQLARAAAALAVVPPCGGPNAAAGPHSSNGLPTTHLAPATRQPAHTPPL